jgi:endonuclease/exonuclease/phosphatase family metal-dependent hydrolase
MQCCNNLIHPDAGTVMTRLLLLAFLPILIAGCQVPQPSREMPENAATAATLRIATFNVSFYAGVSGQLKQALRDGDVDKLKVVSVIQHVRPDILLLNEFDYEADDSSVDLFREKLRQAQPGTVGIDYPHYFRAEVNTGVQSGHDLNRNGRTGDAADAWGFGAYPGQYGMLVLSRYPIDTAALRSFRNFRWRDMPGALRPPGAQGEGWFDEDSIWQQLRLSSKSHWDLPIATPLGSLHLLAMHPTPPVFDGPEDRHGRRNHDEIRLFADYLDPPRAQYLTDDQGRRGGIDTDAGFVVMGDLNADPVDGESVRGAIQQLLLHPRINAAFVPTSEGALAKSVADAGPNAAHRGDPSADTGDFFEPASGNLRIDYVLPSNEFEVVDGGVFWPAPGSPDAALASASDHHMVWLDLRRRL